MKLYNTTTYMWLLLSQLRHVGASQLAADAAGFDVADAIALLRLDDLYVEVFEVKDVKVQLKTQRLLPAGLF